MRFPVRSFLALVLITTLSCAPAASENEQQRLVLDQLDRSMAWLERHPVDPATDSLGKLGYDAWSWFLFATWHPDEAVRQRAGVEVDRRLAALEPPAEWDVVALSYWTMLLRVAELRGTELAAEPPVPFGAALREILDAATPTTAYWMAELLTRVGLPAEPDTSTTLLARGPASLADYTPTLADAYAIFHELVPATGLGTEDAGITPQQDAFVRRALPGWVEVCRDRSDLDCLAELLVVMTLIGERGELYDATLDQLLERRRDDGTYTVGKMRNDDDFRHIVLVGSFALLASLDTFTTRVEAAE